MSDAVPTTIPMPREGLSGVHALIELGEECLLKLAEVQASQPLDLSFSDLFDRLAEVLPCDQRMIRAAFFQALIPLNGLRRQRELSSDEFIKALDHTVSQHIDAESGGSDREAWTKIVPVLDPFFQPDNFFAQASKAFDLLSERPAILKSGRILTELRPIFDEATTRTLALLQTNTLVLDYWDGQSVATLHVTMDSDDLEQLESELARAKQKIQITEKEASDRGSHVVAYGGS